MTSSTLKLCLRTSLIFLILSISAVKSQAPASFGSTGDNTTGNGGLSMGNEGSGAQNGLHCRPPTKRGNTGSATSQRHARTQTFTNGQATTSHTQTTTNGKTTTHTHTQTHVNIQNQEGLQISMDHHHDVVITGRLLRRAPENAGKNE